MCVCELQVKSVLTTLSGDKLIELREELDHIKELFSLVEFDDEEVDEKKGNVSVKHLSKWQLYVGKAACII